MITLPRPTRQVVHQPTREVVPRHVVGQPQKRPRSLWRTFCAEQPNERWQADITHWRLADGSEVDILNIVDDPSRVNLAAHARRITTGRQVVDTFLTAFGRWG